MKPHLRHQQTLERAAKSNKKMLQSKPGTTRIGGFEDVSLNFVGRKGPPGSNPAAPFRVAPPAALFLNNQYCWVRDGLNCLCTRSLRLVRLEPLHARGDLRTPLPPSAAASTPSRPQLRRRTLRIHRCPPLNTLSLPHPAPQPLGSTSQAPLPPAAQLLPLFTAAISHLLPPYPACSRWAPLARRRHRAVPRRRRPSLFLGCPTRRARCRWVGAGLAVTHSVLGVGRFAAGRCPPLLPLGFPNRSYNCRVHIFCRPRLHAYEALHRMPHQQVEFLPIELENRGSDQGSALFATTYNQFYFK